MYSLNTVSHEGGNYCGVCISSHCREQFDQCRNEIMLFKWNTTSSFTLPQIVMPRYHQNSCENVFHYKLKTVRHVSRAPFRKAECPLILFFFHCWLCLRDSNGSQSAAQGLDQAPGLPERILHLLASVLPPLHCGIVWNRLPVQWALRIRPGARDRTGPVRHHPATGGFSSNIMRSFLYSHVVMLKYCKFTDFFKYIGTLMS